MRAAAFAALTFTLAASSLAASDLVLQSPIQCDLGADCFIQQYVDHDASGDAMDYRCSSLSYDTHTGTDFALRSLAQMRRGVPVLASAPGVVRATRDGMRDVIIGADNAETVDGRECGNGVILDHEDGWTTQYCHLKQGSVSVRRGDTVETGAVLGEIGLSGRTQFPHVHLTVRKDGRVVDPFDPDGRITCGAPSTDTLWSQPMPYRPGGVLTVGFNDHVPDYDAVKNGSAATTQMPADAPALVVFGYAFGGRAGDQMQLIIDGPQGEVIDQTVQLDRNQAQFFRAVGRRLTTEEWPRGTYTGTVVLRRGNQVVNREVGRVTVR